MEKLESFFLIAPVLLFSMVAHEYAHGYAALKQGDDTAQTLGRLSWNPLRHIDPVLTILMPVLTFWASGVAFGGAKPVPVNPRLYRHYRRGDIIVSMAGIVVNLALAAIFTLLVVGLGLAGRGLSMLSTSIGIVQVMFVYGITINLVLAVFNLLPIPPLDGSHVVKHLLPPTWAAAYERLAGVGFVVLIVLVTVGRPLLLYWMTPVFKLNRLALQVVSPYVLSNPLAP